MADVGEFIDEFLKHMYDPVKAHEYYMKNRELNPRETNSTVNPKSKVGYNGEPLKPVGQRMEEDEAPETSPSGAKLVKYDGKGLGKATYADGSVYDAASGWPKKKYKNPNYDPVKAHEYYMRHRKLHPRSKFMLNGEPLKPLGQRMEEDETPEVSPTGAKLVKYNGKGLGMATYADGEIYDPSVGWKREEEYGSPERINAAKEQIARVKALASNVEDPQRKAAILSRVTGVESKLARLQ